jgi:hypothetical protein
VVRAVGVAGAAALGAIPAAGCSSLIGLGPDATLRDAATGDPSDTAATPVVDGPASPEVSPADAQFACGLTPHPNAKCNACADQSCCDLGWQCAADPACVRGIQCSLDCAFDATCVGQCVAAYGADGGVYVDYQNCVISHCAFDCLPGPVCAALARCCLAILDANTRELCAGAVNAGDEQGCVVIVTNVLRPQLGPSFCAGIDDAGASEGG